MADQDPTVIPPPAPDLSADHLQRRTEQVMVAFTGLAPPAARWRHRPTRRVAAVAVAVLVLLGLLAVGAYARLRPGPVTQLGAGVGCFAKASLRSDVAVVELKGLDPIARCQEVWASGGMGKPRSAPQLVACVYPSGALAVLPGKDTAVCDRLGLREPAAGELDRLRRFDAMQQAVTQRLELLHSPCVNPATAYRVITAALRAYGFTGWRVELYRMDASGSVFGPLAKVEQHGCAMIGFQGDRHTVQLVVEPFRPTSTTRS
jgi:hypothetical protein